jgi:pSer/pThr/pTyr-binding forkhead associated (FHA) protein
MAYISIESGQRPLGWWELTGPATVGRQRECELSLPDALLSRTHCRFERQGEDWSVVDLASRNGTWCDGISVDRVLLLDGDQIAVGRCVLTFHSGLPPAEGRYQPRLSNRPVDPHEALQGTMVGVTVVERPRDPWTAMNTRVRPRPKPRGVDLELRPGSVGLLEAAEAEPVRHATGFLPAPIHMDLPSLEELLPIAPIRAPEGQTPESVRSQPGIKAAQSRPRAASVNLDFWVFFAVLTVTAVAGWSVYRYVPWF